MIALLLTTHALAFDQAKVCFRHDVDYTDQSTQLNDDYLNVDGPTPAWGARAKVICTDCGSSDVLVWDGYLSDNQAEACKTLPLTTGTPAAGEVSTQHTYRLKLVTEHEVNGHHIVVEKEVGSAWVKGVATKNNVTFPAPTLLEPVPVVTMKAGVHDGFNVAQVAAWVFRQYGNEIPVDSSHSYRLRLPAYVYGATSQTIDGIVYLGPAADRDKRFVIAHELGHAIHWRPADDAAPSGAAGLSWWNYTAAEGGCGHGQTSAHFWESREYHSAAYVEGFANFIAALAFNDPDDNEAEVYYNSSFGIDWNYDGGVGSLADVADKIHSTKDDPSNPWYASYTNWDHLATGISLNNGCTASHANAATEYDYTRMFWDLYQRSTVDLGDLLDVQYYATPTGWPDESVTTDPTNIYHPVQRLRQAATSAGIGTEWLIESVVHGAAE